MFWVLRASHSKIKGSVAWSNDKCSLCVSAVHYLFVLDLRAKSDLTMGATPTNVAPDLNIGRGVLFGTGA